MMNSVEWRGSNQDEIDNALVGTRWVPQYFGRMNAVRLVLSAKGHEDISIGMYDKITVNDKEVTVERHRWGR